MKDQNEACAFQIVERNPKLLRKKSHPPPNKNVGTIKEDVKSIKYSRSSYITNLSHHHVKDSWIFDTAATSHFCCQKNFLQNFQPVKNMGMTVAVGGVTCEIKGTGTVSTLFQSEDSVLEPISNGAILGFKRKSYNVISNSDSETEEETEHQRSPKISKPESSEEEGASNNSNSSVKVIWERKVVPIRTNLEL
ncbi:retrovirus-related Pol polyprotein from transposon TNT 1-94 [Trichonephila clavata]|uniref:Retrovirus-related Pol polyprotein from transposon TNT 1-94 n=1 Tax=Trichonephila clavata TaxID=2740835 RepID=A0A8X6H9B1_TRICU|nr:retrovirus-related Pol polyprotein from transposon TNT 1-94 [Trichonephila clavata]